MRNPESPVPPDQREEALFAAALERPPSERAAFLDGACHGNPALRQRLDDLIAAHEEPEDSLATDPAARVKGTIKLDFPDAPPDEAVGQTLGRYKLLEKVGEGGCGVVYVAEQTEPVRRRVALKVIKLGMDTKQVVARFEAERQALAMMDHPNIAKVLDAGTTDVGRPYFVMELVRGIRITDYCDQANLSTKERLDLFIKVCQAIQHAHQKGIIHRDIKPSNILVTLHDGVPVPKVIDFGIAKATEGRLTDATVYTQLHQFIGTPAYMSPEQAEMSGLDIDTRSDIYSLGVLLYELLAGSTPFDAKELMASGIETMRKTIREKEPVRPSTRLAMLKGEELTTTAKRRSSDAPKLIHLLKGELDWIVMKALEKDRTRRYETANGLGMDIGRYLSGEAVLAAPPSRAYRFRKFVHRNRVMATTGGAVVAALLIGVIAFAWQAKVARDQRDIAVQAQQAEAEQRKSAEAERDKTEKIAGFMSDTLKGAGPSVAKGRDITMLREMMDAASARIEKGELKSAPEAELRLRSTIGETYRELAVFDAAKRMLAPAVALARSTHPDDHKTTAEALISLAVLLQECGDLAEAEPLLREAMEMTKRLFPGDHLDVAGALNNLANLLRERGDLAGAEPLLRESLAMNKRLFLSGHLNVAVGLGNLGNLLRDLGDLAGAEPLYREALEMHKRLIPGDHPWVAIGLDNLGNVLSARGDHAGAEPLIRESLEMSRRLFPGDHPEVAGSLNNMAALLIVRGDPAGAEPLIRESLEMSRRLFPGDHPDVAFGLYSLGRAHQDLGKTAEARQGFDGAIAMLRRLTPEGSPNFARVLWRSGSARLDNKDSAAALPELEEAVAMADKLLPPEHAHLKEYRETLAKCKGALGEQANPDAKKPENQKP